MEAVVSGQAGVALLIDGPSVSSIHIDDMDTIVQRRAGEFHHLFGSASDIVFLEDVSLERVRSELRNAADGEAILQLTLLLLASDRPQRTRFIAADELDEMLKVNRSSAAWAERLLLSAPFPTESDIQGSIKLCQEKSRSDALTHLVRLRDVQPAIRNIQKAWDSIPEELFRKAPDTSRKDADSVFVREGVVREFALVLMGEGDFPSATANALLKPAVRGVSNCRAILTSWSEAASTPHEVPGADDQELPSGIHLESLGEASAWWLSREFGDPNSGRQAESILHQERPGGFHLAAFLCDELSAWSRFSCEFGDPNSGSQAVSVLYPELPRGLHLAAFLRGEAIAWSRLSREFGDPSFGSEAESIRHKVWRGGFHLAASLRGDGIAWSSLFREFEVLNFGSQATSILHQERSGGLELAAYLRGKLSAWSRFSRAIREMLKAVARKRLHTNVESLIDPSDRVQKAMTKAYRSRPRFRGSPLVQFHSWLLRIVISQVHTDNRSWGLRTAQQLPVTKGLDSTRMLPVHEEPAELLSEFDRLLVALQRLPLAQRQAVRLRMLEGWPIEQIASHLECSKEAAAGLIKRAMMTLAELMNAENCPGET